LNQVRRGWTALHVAVDAGHHEVVAELCKHKVNFSQHSHHFFISTAQIIIPTQDSAVQVYANRPPIDDLMETTISILNKPSQFSTNHLNSQRTISILKLALRRHLWMPPTVWEGRPCTLDAS
jgi:ankyrin repeat protein